MISRHHEWRSDVASTLEAIETFCTEFQAWRADACAEVDPFAAELLLREALTNSIMHGSAGDPRKRVRCVLRAKRRRLLVAVQDEGPGFDWRAAWDHQSDGGDADGRGVEIFRRYATFVRFNPKGNRVTLVKRF